MKNKTAAKSLVKLDQLRTKTGHFEKFLIK